MRFFLGLLRDLMIMFRENEEIIDYFDWNMELLEIEKNCFVLFLEGTFDLFKEDKTFKIEDAIGHEFFDAPSYKQLEEQFEEKLREGQFEKSLSDDIGSLNDCKDFFNYTFFFINSKLQRYVEY